MHLSEAIRKWLHKAYIIEVVLLSEYNSLKFRSDNPLLVRHLSYVMLHIRINLGHLITAVFETQLKVGVWVFAVPLRRCPR